MGGGGGVKEPIIPKGPSTYCSCTVLYCNYYAVNPPSPGQVFYSIAGIFGILIAEFIRKPNQQESHQYTKLIKQ
jgi:hypothetical protein